MINYHIEGRKITLHAPRYTSTVMLNMHIYSYQGFPFPFFSCPMFILPVALQYHTVGKSTLTVLYEDAQVQYVKAQSNLFVLLYKNISAPLLTVHR